MSRDFSKLEGFILQKMSESKIPGLSIAIVDAKETIYARGFGFRDIASGLPVSPLTLFGVGSVTKSFTAIAALQLVEEGKLELNDAVEKYLPIKLRPHARPSTIHNLLTHSSGIPALAYAEAFIKSVLGMDGNWLPISKPEDIITFMRGANHWAVAQPGSRFFYLNEGYVLLGLIVSKLSGVSYEEYVRQRILHPLKMNRSFFAKVEFERDKDRATAYIVDKEEKHIPSSFPYGVNADGGLISNVIDLSNYLRMLINRGRLDGKRIISTGMLETMETPHIRLPYEVLGNEAYGYGWSMTPNFFGLKLVGHSGSVGVYTSYVGYLPERRVGVALLANPSQHPMAHIGRYALAELVGKDPESLPFIKSDRILSKLQGQYETYMGTMKVTIKKKGDFLYLESKDRYTEQVTPLVPEEVGYDHARFYTLVGGIRYLADFTIKDGKIELIYERYKLVKKT